MRRLALVALAVSLAAVATPAAAQNSIFGVRGIGFPGRPVSARARSLGGGPTLFDPWSAVNPAAAGGLGRVTAYAVSGTEYRGYRVDGGVDVGGLRSTRFPLALVGGRIRGNLGFSLSFGTYAERTFDVTIADTLLLRGEPVVVDDRIQSDGGIADMRGAIAWRPLNTLLVGVAGHLMSGSAKLRLQRAFADSAFRPLDRRSTSNFAGEGVSAGLIWSVISGVRLAAAGRLDTRLTAEIDSAPAGDVDLPLSLGGALEIAVLPAVRLSSSVTWRSWSDAADDLGAGETASDTWEVGAGLEVGGAATGTSRVPLRLGFRYAQLPFSPGTKRPREIDLAVGTGLVFASSRAVLDVSIERAMRDGARVAERAWQVFVGMTVRP